MEELQNAGTAWRRPPRAIHRPEGGYARTRTAVVQLRSGRREANHRQARRRLLRRDGAQHAKGCCTTPLLPMLVLNLFSATSTAAPPLGTTNRIHPSNYKTNETFRSNQSIREALDFLAEHRFLLTPNGQHGPCMWGTHGENAEIRDTTRGWDVTDSARGTSHRKG